MDLYIELQETKNKLNRSIKELRKSGQAYAEAERTYKILFREECLKLRDEGTAIGLIKLTAYGIPEIAEARYNRDIAQTVYEANKEAINVFKLELRLLENQIQREWANATN